MAPTRELGGTSPDGRVRRGVRNNEAIIQAICELIRASHVPPSVDAIAGHAGVGRRTVFRQFQDLDALYRTIGSRVMREALSLVVPAAPSENLETDLAALVQRRARIFEYIAPFRRAARHVRHESAFLQDQDRLTTTAFRAAMLSVLAPYVDDADADTIDALDLLLSFEAWERLRHQRKASVRRAQAILVSAALALVRAGSGATSGAIGEVG